MRRGVWLGRCGADGLADAAGCFAGGVRGGRREMPCSVFRGANRPRRILPVGKMLRWLVVWRGGLFCGRSAADGRS